MSMNPAVLSTPSLTSLIEVRPPYFSLESVRLDQPGRVRAAVSPEQPRGAEQGPVAAAEAGRHLAILGSLACASLAPHDGRHYYLAHRAVLVRSPSRPGLASTPGKLAVEAHGARDKRSASAECVLRDALGSSLFSLSVDYRILAERVFQRMFAAHRLDMRSARRSDAGTPPCSTILSLRQTPYARPLPLDYSKMTGDHSKAVLREISPQLCAGHFPLYPAMPIALLMHGLSTLCGGMLGAQAGAEVPYTVERAEVSAERLAFAGESLTFEARRVDEDAERTTFEASATLHSGETAGEMRLFTQRR